MQRQIVLMDSDDEGWNSKEFLQQLDETDEIVSANFAATKRQLEQQQAKPA
jgi:hypothetical protein